MVQYTIKRLESKNSPRQIAKQAWYNIKNRCYNPNHIKTKNYLGRGITVCDEWKNDFDAFYKYVGDRPSVQHSLDRIDNDGNYEPGNVRWATYTEQARNKRVQNKNGYPGLLKLSDSRWSVKICVKYKYIHLGIYEKKEDAVEARRLGELRYWS